LGLSTQDISRLIKLKAEEIGFQSIGFSRADKLIEEEDRLSQWLGKGYQGQMQYLEHHFSMRLNPKELLPDTKSVISLLYNYFPEKELGHETYKIARYAYGKDYHKVIKKRLKKLTAFMEESMPGIGYRVFVDSAPIMERQWAVKAGLGWIGKNGLLINKEKGSYFFIADILVDVELSYDVAMKDYCGSCTSCLDACPTGAFPQPYVLDASKCISYATIELKDDQIPDSFKGKMEDWIYGCDICQEACPWNRFSKHHNEVDFLPNEILTSMSKKNWEEIEESKYKELFSGSAVKRAKFEGLKRNIRFVSGV
jgi:epoxyqueuosine reductase